MSRRIPRPLAALGACVLGIACGSAAANRSARPLPPAGSERDDGGGLLYELSVRPQLGWGGGGGVTYGGAQGGATYGGQGSGSSAYGGTRYADYRFEAVYQPSSSPPQPYGGGYAATSGSEHAGTIVGTVSWPAPPQAAGALRLDDPPEGCEGELENPSLAVAEDGAVRGAVVFLEDIRRGRGLPEAHHYARKLQIGGILRRRDCRLSPHVQVVAPIGSILTVVNQDAGDRSLRATRRRASGTSGSVAFEIELAERGALGGAMLESDGFYLLEGTTGRDPAHAWVVVAPHPYYVVTDARGAFRLDEVPPGTYTLVVWHPPVVSGVGRDGALERTGPVVERRKVRVRPRGRRRVSIELTR